MMATAVSPRAIFIQGRRPVNSAGLHFFAFRPKLFLRILMEALEEAIIWTGFTRTLKTKMSPATHVRKEGTDASETIYSFLPGL